MFLSRSSSSHPLSNQYPTAAPLGVTAPVPAHMTDTGATGDARLAQLYAAGIRQLAQTPSGQVTIKGIPGDSKFGAWWQHLFNTTHSPMFLEWAKSNNIDTSQPIQMNPYSDTLRVTINGESVEMQGAKQGAAWREATRPLMAVAKALGLYETDAPTDPRSAPIYDVAHFYGEVLLPDRKEDTLARATRLEQNQAFDVLGPNTYVKVENQTPEILAQQKGELGDSTDRFMISQKLGAFDPAKGHSLNRYLASTRVAVHPDSSYKPGGQRADASLEDMLSASGWRVPQSPDELQNLVRALTAPGLPTSDYGNFGGALEWPTPLSVEEQGELFRIVADNTPPLPGLDGEAVLGSADVLGALIKKVPRTVLNQGGPLAIMQSLLETHEAKTLGQALKERMGDVAANSTPQELVMTALWVSLDGKGLDDPKIGHVAGFDLASPKHFGQPLSVIKQRLIDHLSQQHITTAEAAPVAAMLLLQRAAPELLVRDIPEDLRYGSFAWLSLKSAAARIEATSPGASAQMSFTEVVAFDTIDPVTDEEEEIQVQAAVPGVIEWGKVHGTLPLQGPYSAQQLTATRQAISQRQQQMSGAVNALTAPVPTQRSVALAELKALFGEGIAFEEKSIRSHRTTTDSHNLTPSISLDPVGSYSLLDLYLSKKAGLNVGWHSSNRRITASVIERLQALPDPIKKHEAAFEAYAANLSTGWSTVTQNLISNLPLEDRKNIEWGQLTVYQRGESVRTDVSTPNGSHSGEAHFSSFDNDRSLTLKTERNGLTTFYELDPQRNVLRKRDDLKDSFKEGLQGPEVKTSPGLYAQSFTAPAIRRLNPGAEDVDKAREVEDRSAIPASFASNRSAYLGKLLSDTIIESYRMGSLKESTREATTFDKEDERNAFMRNLVLGFIPGASALWNLAHGNYKDAAADVVFDVVMYVTTAGLGKGAGALKGSKNLRKPFGGALLKGVGQGAESGAQAGRSIFGKFSSGIRSRIQGHVEQSGVRLNPKQARVVAERTDLFEGTAKAADGTYQPTIAKYQRSVERWYPYDPVTDKHFGKPLVDFKPSTSTHLDTNWQNVTRKAENGPHGAAFRDGYVNGDPATVPGYTPDMTYTHVRKFTANTKSLSPKHIGILVRQQERLAVQHALNGANTFSDAVRAAGGSVTPMPQLFYLSQVQPLSHGQCAALSHLMAQATTQGQVRTLIENFYTAAANPKAASSRKFINTLTELQKRVETPTQFHGIDSKTVPSKSYTTLADDLAQSPGSKTLMFGDDRHAMTAGVIGSANNRSYFFFEPNYGFATFPSADSLRAGLKDIFTNRQFARPYKTTGPAGKGFEIKVSEHNSATLSTVGADTAAVTKTYSELIG